MNLGAMETTAVSIGYYTILYPKTSFCRDGKIISRSKGSKVKQPNNNALLG
jgi:hypothetical protein